ncbi:MAG: MgtC/SapB family protein [Sphingopyxis sp.]|uniref:MgtC/SapB family protein n=1 Tax=Sphingopyxis sp. TaxID=1908224 RepID=UPI001A1A0F7B|nr:MgtC/SapB family protein [Sphingopyxis sp.]MBJ7500437.1 MgtC/SapB family protein [Sphingopyxis sp.]
MELNDALWLETIDTQVLLRLGVATLVGLVLGLDRELKGYDAGLRTHGLVALSASLMTVVAIALYYQLGGPQSRVDPLRVIEGMAAAVGIIAAGLIIVKGGEVRNLTTAAHIWLTAAIGIASGAGYFAVVLIGAALALVLLVLLRFVERRLPEVEDGPERSEDAPR